MAICMYPDSVHSSRVCGARGGSRSRLQPYVRARRAAPVAARVIAHGRFEKFDGRPWKLEEPSICVL